MNISAAPLLRPAVMKDSAGIFDLFSAKRYVHRHPGWRNLEDWVNRPPFWVLEDPSRSLTAALSCPVEPAGVAWVRLFATRFPNRPAHSWPLLFEKVYLALPETKPIVAALGIENWFCELLGKHQFQEQNSIVILYWEAHRFPQKPHTPHLKLRKMHSSDLIHVLRLDQQAFQPLWQLSWEALSSAFHLSAYATVAELDGKIAGYQISTTTHTSTCLERLAVSPGLQNQGIGAALVYDLIEEYQVSNATHLTVNTQKDNLPSQTLYKKMGFNYTGEIYPVFVYQP